MIDPTQKAVETSRGGKPKGEEPTDLEIAFRAQNGTVADVAEIEKALGSVQTQLAEAKAQVTKGANATVRRISRIVGEALATAKAAEKHAAATKNDVKGSAYKLRQAAIYDAQRSASWSAMEAEVREANKSEAARQQVAVNAISEAQHARDARKYWALYGVLAGFVVGAGSVVLSLAVYVAAG